MFFDMACRVIVLLNAQLFWPPLNGVIDNLVIDLVIGISHHLGKWKPGNKATHFDDNSTNDITKVVASLEFQYYTSSWFPRSCGWVCNGFLNSSGKLASLTDLHTWLLSSYLYYCNAATFSFQLSDPPIITIMSVVFHNLKTNQCPVC